MKANISAFRCKGSIFGTILLTLFCAGCQLFGGDPAQENRARFEARLEEFSQIPSREQLTDQPYIKGRALVITRRQDPAVMMREDPVYWGEQNSDRVRGLMAETPEQVETVVLLNYSKERAGTYNLVGESGGAAAYREICELIVIDRSIPAIIHRRTFRGPDPLTSTSINHGQAAVTTPVDLSTVRRYIVELPRR